MQHLDPIGTGKAVKTYEFVVPAARSPQGFLSHELADEFRRKKDEEILEYLKTNRLTALKWYGSSI
jgi:hypothetical protein